MLKCSNPYCECKGDFHSMRYLFKCESCENIEEVKLPVEKRHQAQKCPACKGKMQRSFKDEIKTSRIILWSAWCESTAQMLRPTYEDDVAYEKSLEEVKYRPKTAYQKQQERIRIFNELHGKVEAGVI